MLLFGFQKGGSTLGAPLNSVMIHEHCSQRVGIASPDHRICSLQFAAKLMLTTGIIFILRITIFLVPSPEQAKGRGTKTDQTFAHLNRSCTAANHAQFQHSVIMPKKETCKCGSVS